MMGAKVQSLRSLPENPSPTFPRLIKAAEDKAVALVEQGIRALQSGMVAILRSKRRLQVRGIVDRVRPGVRREKFVMVAEALAQIGAQAVVDRAAV